MMTEIDLIKRHQAALRAIDLWDDQAAINAVLNKTGPRTGTHPMATRIEPEAPRPMATRIRPPLLDRDMDDFGTANRIIECAIHCLVLAAAVIVVISLILEFGA